MEGEAGFRRHIARTGCNLHHVRSNAHVKKGVVVGGLIIGVVSAVLWLGAPPDFRREREYQFVYDALLTREYGDQGPTVARWIAPVTFAVRSENQNFKPKVRAIVNQLDGVIGPGFLRMSDGPNAAVWIYVEDRLTVTTILDRKGVKYPPEFTGYLNADSSDKSVIMGAYILVVSDLSDEEISATLIQEITQSLGPMGDSPVFPESVMYETATERSRATSLAPIDRKLLRFLYQHLNPGDDEAAVRAAFDRHWALVPSD